MNYLLLSHLLCATIEGKRQKISFHIKQRQKGGGMPMKQENTSVKVLLALTVIQMLPPLLSAVAENIASIAALISALG